MGADVDTVCDNVTSQLRSYADRGVFRNFHVENTVAGRVEYRFKWLMDQPLNLICDANRAQIKLVNLLPAVPYPSAMDQAMRQFIRSRAESNVPAHRRLDNGRFQVRLENRQEKVSLLLEFSADDAAEAARCCINLVHEIFNNFLLEGPYQNYMIEQFAISEE